ncbi:MAG: helix-hairpin-helix domain-containing protein [Vicingaceae bacterium]|nr:helix-hairpin-helix domain-containing protein [Vicingaceae bacterium]
MSIKDYFAFTRGEKRGAVVLLLLITLLIVAQFFTNTFTSTKQTDFSEFEEEINAFEKLLKEKDNFGNKSLSIELFEFNPNFISNNEWKRLGFKDWQIKTINKYKSKGGNWKTKSDVAKIYGLDNSHFEQLKPYILLPDVLEYKSSKHSKEESPAITLFEFNPNIISKSEWKKLGFKDWQIKTIFNYKAKGGSWKIKSDVSKIYGLSPNHYKKLIPYILLPVEKEKQTKKAQKDYSKKVDINTADAKELTNLKGIYSEKYAAIIIKHRDKLGGFSSKEQLKDVWNMSIETYNGFINQVIIGKYEPIKININTSSASQLQSHPYIDWKTANAITKYRKANGKYKSVDDVKKIHLISSEVYRKIAPYLKIK